VNPRWVGGVVAFSVFAADQTAKITVLMSSGVSTRTSTPVLPFLDLALRWNRGISFSLFVEDSTAGHMALLGLTTASVALLVWWLSNCHTILAAAGLGAIIGGALGNAFDRLVHGAVVDFLDLHLLGQHLFVFNLADAAINIGVSLLVIDLMFGSRRADGGTPAASQRAEK
jgi:signal peptidase II